MTRHFAPSAYKAAFKADVLKSCLHHYKRYKGFYRAGNCNDGFKFYRHSPPDPSELKKEAPLYFATIQSD
ncbi:hypothetical protein N9L70_02910 [Rhodobacteraceae bacterium]|nr:hypothetical protein [Paracoccaceae bacterium]